jgi:hypothetical protein
VLSEENVWRVLKLMRDVTDLMNSYRECARHVWNVYFGTQENTSHLERLYEGIRKLLFEGLVLVQLEGNSSSQDQSPVLRVVPIASVPILIRRPSDDRNWYWDEEQGIQVDRDEIELVFADYYDYSVYPVRDFRFYRCKILRFPSRGRYEGRDALVEVAHARVLVDGLAL